MIRVGVPTPMFILPQVSQEFQDCREKQETDLVFLTKAVASLSLMCLAKSFATVTSLP